MKKRVASLLIALSFIQIITLTACTSEGTYLMESSAVSDKAADIDTASGEGWYANEITQNWSDGKATYYLKAYFKWDHGKITVANSETWEQGHSDKIDIVSDEIVTGVDWHWFHDCGYAKRTIKFKNFLGDVFERSVTVRVNSTNGNPCL